MIRNYFTLCLAVLGISLSLINYVCCSRSNAVNVVDTILVPPPPPDTVVKSEIVPVVKYRDIVHNHRDTLRIIKYVRERDSIGQILQATGATVELSLDTITHNNDTVSIRANEIERTISFGIRYAERSIQVVRPIERIVEKPSWAIGVGVGYGISLDGVMYPTLSLNLSKTLFTF